VTDQPCKVMVVEDSMVVRRILTDIIDDDPRLSTEWTATDGVDCLEQLKTVRPDVITLDVEMPNLAGLETLEEILRIHALPVVMISSHTRKGEQVTVQALEMGAIDFVAKPLADSTVGLFRMAQEINEKVFFASNVDMEKVRRLYKVIQLAKYPKRIKRRIIVLGASTGGPRTLQCILQAFSSDFPAAILVAQHMPSGFTRELAGRLNATCRMTVREARDGDLVTPGNVLIAPGGDLDMVVERNPDDDSTVVRIHTNTDEISPAPSVDQLMLSVAEAFPGEAIGVLLTGMGVDGAVGLKRMREAKCHTIVESEESCIIFGMPKKAIELDAADEVTSKELIAEIVLRKLAF